MSFLFRPTESSGSVTVLDDFEDGDISEYAGDTGSFTVQQTTVKEGSYALSATANGSISDTGVTTQQGERFYVWVNIGGTNNDGSVGFYYFTQSESASPNGYLAQVNESQNEIALFYYDGAFTKIASAASQASTSTWYELRVDVTTSGDHTLSIYDTSGSQLASTSTVTDTTYTSGGIGFRSAVGEDGFHDHYRKEAL